MGTSTDPVLRLRAQIVSLEGVLADLKTQLTRAEAYYNQTAPTQVDTNDHSQTNAISYPPIQSIGDNDNTFETLVDQLELPQEDRFGRSWELRPEEYKRYGRQLIMPEIGLRGGPSSLEYNVRLSLTRIGNRTAAIEKCLGPDRRRGRSRMSSCHIPRRCRGGKDRPHGR